MPIQTTISSRLRRVADEIRRYESRNAATFTMAEIRRLTSELEALARTLKFPQA